MRTSSLAALATGALCLVTLGCSREAPAPPPPIQTAPKAPPPVAEAPAPALRQAKAVIAGLSGSPVTGEVTFTDTGNGISIEAHVNGLTEGKHGFHIHEKGDCSGDGSAAGPHFNPAGMDHGGPDAAALHAGDMGNITADATGHAMMTMLSKHITLDDSATGILGRAVIVHEKEDDLTSQPAGNAGPRIGCGVIQLVEAAPAASASPAEAAAPATGEPAASHESHAEGGDKH